MTTPEISLIYPSRRLGSIDMLGVYLHRQDNAPPYELLVVDDCPGRVERGEANKYLEKMGIPLAFYDKSKPKSYPDTKYGFANALNTALLHVRTPYVVFLTDYMFLSDDALERWSKVIKKMNGKALISGVGVVFTPGDKPNKLGDVTTWKTFPNLAFRQLWAAEEFETFYFGAETAFFDAINGCDETTDHCFGWFNDSILAQAKALGYPYDVNPYLQCFIVDHHIWEQGGKDWRVDSEPEESDYWTNKGFEILLPSPNPYNFAEIRKQNIANKI